MVTGGQNVFDKTRNCPRPITTLQTLLSYLIETTLTHKVSVQTNTHTHILTQLTFSFLHLSVLFGYKFFRQMAQWLSLRSPSGYRCLWGTNCFNRQPFQHIRTRVFPEIGVGYSHCASRFPYTLLHITKYTVVRKKKKESDSSLICGKILSFTLSKIAYEVAAWHSPCW